MSIENETQAINQHYAPPHLATTLTAALQAAGKDLNHLRPEDLHSFDQFHSGGKQTTFELIQLADFQPASSVLDVGGGIGGSARLLATEKGCHVTVLDLTEDYCQVGAMLTERVGLSESVTFQHGNALAMPFADNSFDAAWTQHSTMNISDKARLYAEIYRVLKPGGKLAFHDVMAGPVQPALYPLPWAATPDISFLLPAEEVRTLLQQTGFKEQIWNDTTTQSLAWFRHIPKPAPGTPPPPLGQHLVFGPAIGARIAMLQRNLEEGRLVIIQGVLEKD